MLDEIFCNTQVIIHPMPRIRRHDNCPTRKALDIVTTYHTGVCVVEGANMIANQKRAFKVQQKHQYGQTFYIFRIREGETQHWYLD